MDIRTVLETIEYFEFNTAILLALGLYIAVVVTLKK